MNYAGKVYVSGVLMGDVCANTFTALKRKASILCNKRYGVIDEMKLHRANGKDFDKLIILTRYNKLSPDNRIIRGQWN